LLIFDPKEYLISALQLMPFVSWTFMHNLLFLNSFDRLRESSADGPSTLDNKAIEFEKQSRRVGANTDWLNAIDISIRAGPMVLCIFAWF